MKGSRVLAVDDESNILSAMQRALRKEDFEFVTTSSPDEALKFLCEQSFAVLISDQRMPVMEGAVLLEHARKLAPDTIRIMLTGYADMGAVVRAINQGAVSRYLTKPCNDDELRVVIRQAVEQYELISENKRLQALTRQQNAALKELNDTLEKRVVERTCEVVALNQELEKTFVAAVQVMADLAELNSATVGSHTKRVSALAKELGKQIGLNGRELFDVELAALLHDVGKVGLRPEIVNRPEEQLNYQERDIYRSHVLRGEAIIKKVPHLGSIPAFVRHHHERWDGAGFPDRLQGAAIPLGAQLIAIADAYDNALNMRVGFESATPDKALQRLQSRKPNAFSSGLIDRLVACIRGDANASEDTAVVEIHLKDLRVGMVLSKELRTGRGVLLLPEGSVIQERQLFHVQRHQESDPIVDSICVYRKRLESSADPDSTERSSASK